MKGLTSSLWPIHYKPLPDEPLSSWLVRLAHGHGLKVQTFCNIIFGNRLQVWNRDIDRLGPDWLLNELIVRTGVSREIAYGTTLRAYEGVLYPEAKASGSLQWMQTLMVYHRTRQAFGQQFCPACLAQGHDAYFRKSWRVSFCTICLKHHCMLNDRCPQCSAAIAFHRMHMGQGSMFEDAPLSACYACHYDLCKTPRDTIVWYDTKAAEWLRQLHKQLDALTHSESTSITLGLSNVMRHLAGLLVSRYETVKLREYVLNQIGVHDIELPPTRMAFESRPLLTRHHLMQLIAWLMVDQQARLCGAWRAKAVRYNHLLKDFDDAPKWYVAIVDEFSDWRQA